MWISKDVKEVQDGLQQALATNLQPVLNELFTAPYTKTNEFVLGSTVLKDIEWASILEIMTANTSLKGVAHQIRMIFQSPEKIPLQTRDAIHSILASQTVTHPSAHSISSLMPLEPDALWALNAQLDHPLTLLFPTMPILRLANRSMHILHALHLYKIILSPAMQIGMPLSSVVGPYYLMRRQLGVRIPLKMYLKMVYAMGISAIKPTYRNFQKDVMKVGSVLFYIVMYIYGSINAIEYAKTTFSARKTLLQRSKNIRKFLELYVKNHSDFCETRSFQLYDTDPMTTLQECKNLLATQGAFPFLYKCLSEGPKATIRNAIDHIYSAEAAKHLHGHIRQNGWCLASYTSSLSHPPVEFFGMGHPLLGSDQIKNPARLDFSIVMTGPNAAGKSTYARSILTNTLLCITFGACVAKKGTIGPIFALFSHMRLQDQAGVQSLFEAEVKSCSTLLGAIERARPWSLVFMDEPMHSTNPIEGAAATMGLVKRLSDMAGVRAVVTTHYHQTSTLVGVRHLSVEAIRKPNGQFEFPYKIRNGPSSQCIALDLLRERIDDSFLDDAVRIKEELCKTSSENKN